MICEIEDKIFTLEPVDFEQLALEVFQFQYNNNAIYQHYVNALSTVGSAVRSIDQIPFLPIRFFKTADIKTTVFEPEAVFESSGTTQTINSRHYVKDLGIYRRSFLQAWEQFYGPVQDWCVIGLLPAYLERQNSSLVVMVNEMIKLSGHAQSGFYLYEHEKLASVLQELEKKGQKTLLIGVTFGLLDFAEQYPMPLKHTVVMETGGMKGRRREMTREEVHDILSTAFKTPLIHSEYGMTELLSQAYSYGHGLFDCPPWMKVLVRQDDDPLDVRISGSGVINIIDLANLYSCSFIATDDVGTVTPDGSFEILGRMDTSDIRGCNLLIAGI
ncbi:acyl transferase [Niastella yeongjuensis]|uniref:Acyl transferase n=1 Tax=Niastella yeongjuensis TaxID=354355 RepID=A0A1V9DXV3_9BACT|nr:acyl transferase [Niastella yeongjuensis]OQP38707.1 acyl transferase [Niastella yeongjuensis]SEO35591.1 Acyl-protein synthetase, LuxE [Niastella yeongjuensis]